MYLINVFAIARHCQCAAAHFYYLHGGSWMQSDRDMCVAWLSNGTAGLLLEPFPRITNEIAWNRMKSKWNAIACRRAHLLDRRWYPISCRRRSSSAVSLCRAADPLMPTEKSRKCTTTLDQSSIQTIISYILISCIFTSYDHVLHLNRRYIPLIRIIRTVYCPADHSSKHLNFKRFPNGFSDNLNMKCVITSIRCHSKFK